jgi:enoyl-CoA hydratase/carnithine racemase
LADSVLYEERDGVALITINRPERLNTLTVEVIEEQQTASNKPHMQAMSRRLF